jgi:hypothetical protein
LKALRGTALGMLLLLASCEVESTPAEYIDRATPEESGRTAAAAEVRDRVLAMGQALGRRSSGDALLALAPARDLFVVGLDSAGSPGAGAERMGMILDSLAARPVPVLTRDLVVHVAPRANVAWFHAVLDGEGEEAPAVRITGVYQLNEGAWQLVQAHLSAPLTPPTPSNPAEADADSVEAG